MAIRNFAKYIAAALLAVACTSKEMIETQAPTTSEPVVSYTIPGQATIQFTDEMAAFIEEGQQEGGALTKSADMNAILSELGAVSLERVFPDAGPFEGRTRRAGLHRFYKIVFSGEAPMTKAVTELSDMPGVVSVTPHHRIAKRAVFNDPYLSRQWEFVSNNNANIHVQEVWQKYTTGSSKVVVDVVDEPVDATHEDLKANLWKDADGHTGYNFARNSWDLTIRPDGGYVGNDWVDGDSGHGTHVAGTVAAVNNNGIGLCGVAGGNAATNNKGARLQSSAIFSGYNYSADDPATAAAIKWGADHGALISQNSWGFVYDESIGINQWMTYNIENSSPEIKAAVDYFIQYAGCDDAGNQLPDSPMKGGLVIFAAGNDNVKWDIISTYEPIIAVGAYGASAGKASYSNYGNWVDVAAPGGEGTTSSNSIWSTLPKVVEDGETGYGGTSWAGTSMACPHVSGVAALIISYFGKQGFTADDAKKILFGGLGNTIGGSKPVGKKLDAAASFSWALANGYTGEGGGTVVQNPPVIKLSKTEVSVHAHETIRVGFEAYDPDGDNITLSCNPGSDALTLDANNKQLVISGWKAKAGTYKAVVTVSDGGRSADAEFTYTLLPNHAPQVVGELKDVLMEGLQKVNSIPLEGIFADEDGETLSLFAERGDAVCVSVKVENNRLKIAPITYGTATITVTATDFMGADAKLTLRVAVTDPKQPVRVSPEVASTETVISIESETPVSVNLSLYASTGGLVYKTVKEASAFDPIHLDVSTLAPGRYTAVLEYGGNTRQVRVIKY